MFKLQPQLRLCMMGVAISSLYFIKLKIQGTTCPFSSYCRGLGGPLGPLVWGRQPHSVGSLYILETLGSMAPSF